MAAFRSGHMGGHMGGNMGDAGRLEAILPRRKISRAPLGRLS